MSQTVKNGHNVAVHYTGTLTDGTVFDSSVDREPLDFTVGTGQMIAGFDAGVVGMAVGETKTINIPAAEAYGEEDESLIITVPRQDLPQDLEVFEGVQLMVTQEDGSSMPVTVVKTAEDHIIINANHQLAGKDLVFEITMVSIK